LCSLCIASAGFAYFSDARAVLARARCRSRFPDAPLTGVDLPLPVDVAAMLFEDASAMPLLPVVRRRIFKIEDKYGYWGSERGRV
jgi:hypothetical protein